MFSNEFQKKLIEDKHTKWITKLTEDKLETLLWMTGEFGHDGCNLLEVLEKHVKEVTLPRPCCERALIALQTIRKIVCGDQVDSKEAKSKIREIPGYER